MAERAADTNTHLSVLMPPTRKGNVTFIGSKRAIRTQTLLRPQLIQSGYGLFHSSLTADYLGSRPFSSLWVARRAMRNSPEDATQVVDPAGRAGRLHSV